MVYFSLSLSLSLSLLQSPPYAVSVEKRREAEAIFMDLKQTQRPYDACKFILGQTLTTPLV